MSTVYESLFEYKDYSNESISQQSSKFFNQLTSIIKPLVRKSTSEILIANIDEKLSLCIKENMGVAIPITLKEKEGNYFKYYTPTINSPLITNDYKALEYFKKCKIKTNDKTARIEGDISAFNISINIDPLSFTNLDAEEIAATLLHELGHAYYTFALIGQFVRITYSLRDVSRKFDHVTTSEREVYLTNVADENNLPSIDIDSLKNSKSSTEVIIVFYNELVRKFRSELNVGAYDKTLSEYLADQFAVRHGAGKYLVTRLSKLDEEYGDVNYLSLVTMDTLINFTKFSIIPVIGLLINPITAGTIATGLLLFLFTKSTKKISGSSTDIYDQDRERLVRIRQSMQLRMRQNSLSKEESNRYIEDIKIIDNIIDQTKNNDLLTTFVTRLIGDNYKRLSQQQLIATYERLAYNRLFDKAFELNQLT